MPNLSSLTTKGLVAGGGDAVPVSVALSEPPDALVFDVATTSTQVLIVVPTAVNVSLMAAENIVNNLRVRQPASLTLPSIYKRAYLVANETDEIALVKGK